MQTALALSITPEVLPPVMVGTLGIGPSFVLAGRAIFTVTNPKGDRYTFRVKVAASTPTRPAAYFVGLLTGPDNTGSYTYIGVLDPATGAIRHTQKSGVAADAIPFKVAAWALALIWARKPAPAGYDILHAGRCGRCGRILTVPESILSGLGPECARRALVA